MELKTCKTCGGSLKKLGNYYVCEFCGNRWESDVSDDINAVQRSNAWETLRSGDFEKAESLFDEIIVKDSKNYEAYWGKALSAACITYVTDLNENKKIPTCNNITEESFVENKYVKKAIELAPEKIAEEYKKQAKYIDDIRVEWLEKAKKEPDYDVFISYKDSDKEHGIDRTRDSIDAQDLYNALTEEGYKVFFSRISLRDKVSEQYEPYIYNAIKTAKVMIVFGEKVEYFSSTWIKNEWTRFKVRIEKKEKHPNSLVVVYKNIDPNDLPVILKSRQCLNMQDVTFLRTLSNHIKKVTEAAKQSQKIDKITISGGKMAKKSTEIAQKTIQVRDVGQGALVETSIDDEHTFSLVKTYIRAKQFEQAKSLLDDLLFNNPNNAEFIMADLQISKKCVDNEKLFSNFNFFTQEDFGIIEKVLNCAKKEYAEDLIDMLYRSALSESDNVAKKIYLTILPFNHVKRNYLIDRAFNNCIDQSKYNSFLTLLTTLNEKDVDKYISLNIKFAKSARNIESAAKCLQNVFAVDEGNVEAYETLLQIKLNQNADFEDLKTTFEKILSYSSNCNEKVKAWLEKMATAGENCYNDKQTAFIKQLIRYYQSDIAELGDTLMKIAKSLLAWRKFDDADYFYKLVLNGRKDDPEVYLGICLAKIKATDITNIKDIDSDITKIAEFNKYLSLLSEQDRIKILEKYNNQQLKNKAEREQNQKLQNVNARNRREYSRSKKISIICFLVGIALLVLGFYMMTLNDMELFALLTFLFAVIVTIIGAVHACKMEVCKSDEILYKEFSDHCIIKGYLGIKNIINVPESLNGKTVTGIADYAFKGLTVYKVNLPRTITVIGEGAFQQCTKLVSVNLPSSLREIGDYAFKGCVKLENMVIPSNVRIGQDAFCGTDNAKIQVERKR